MADANLSDLFENSVQVTTNELTCDLNPGEVDHSEAPNRVLLGKLYLFSRLGRKAIQGSLNNAWSSLVGWSWKEREDGLLQFTFQSSWDADNVLLRRPWLVCGHLLVLMPWPSWLTPSEVVFDQTPLWVRLKSIPPFYWNKTNLQELAGKVSASYELPRHIEKNFKRGSFGMGTLRFRAIVDIEKPLFSGFYLRRKGIKNLWIRYQYEKLPKMCFKCGALSHDLKFCFKTPTVIKDEKGSFFPMFGTWMNEDAVERSPFHLPLPKWFSDWILQQQTVKDPETRNKLRIERRWKEAEAMECRELRRQLPGKRRQVEVLVEKRPATKEVVMNRFPAVHLPGIGEITPFENTSDMVVEKEMPVRPNPTMGTSPGESSNKTDAGRAVSLEETTTEKDGTILSHTNRSEASPNIAHDRELEKLPEKGGTILSTAKNPEPHTPSPHPSYLGVQDRENFTLQEKFQFGQFINSLLGPQAQPLEWPSRLCWARSFQPLMGSTTIDKFHREPTLFNPILDIEDFKCMETEHGPKKRKAVDGFYMIPGRLQSYDEGPSGVVTPEAKNKQVNHNSDEGGTVAQFSPGSNEQAIQKRKRGRPRKINDPCKLPSSYTKKESITMPNERIGVKTKSLKRRKRGSSIKGNSSQYRNLWNVKGIDLTIDLDNHFVVVEKAKKQYPGRMVSRTGLIDLGCQGGRFTWYQKASTTQGSAAIKRARLDRALASTEWRILFPNAIVELLTVSTSDHKPIMLNTEGGARCSKPQFKYELMWGRDPRCFWVVRNAWREELHTNPMINLYRKLKKTKDHLQKWNKTQFRHIRHQVEEAKSLNRSRDIHFLVDRALQRVKSWKTRLLSKVGKTCLIQSVGSSLATYVAASEPIPLNIAKKVDRCRRDFWWGDTDEKRKIHLLAWDSICQSKFRGDLGFRRIEVINQAFMAKWAWKALTDKTSIWSMVVNAKYIKDKNFLDLEKKGSESGLWKAILDARSVLGKGLCRKIENGHSTSIWFDPWVPSSNRTPTPLKDATHGVAWVHQFLNNNNTWNTHMVRELFGNEDANAILNIDLPEVNTDDSWQWVGEYNGLFSIKSAYRLIKSTVLRTNEEDVWKLMWNSPIHSRLKFLWWQVKEHLLVANQKVVNILAWAPPPPQWACCNSDVAVLPNGSMLAAVIRDDSGSILSISTQEASYTDPLVAEAKAVAAEAATTQCNVDFRIEAAKMRFVQYCSMFEEWEITHISRMCNFAAHNVAKWAAMGRKSGAFVPHDMDSGVLDDLREWDPGPPNQLSRIAEEDKCGFIVSIALNRL
ncbi:hypothetical protein G4B88_022178 [Cannabis sativa]|uniref:DUF4283 domain-containing protein n=1 Tax=Cannabis sativa TaxID=3483 RepID=A0A7J6FGG9_CANSA|nr:hypothetical protein G4B88_022178 [Cannabis sativa]